MNHKQKDEYHKKVNENIQQFGYHSTFVFSQDSPSFCYSTGIFENFKIPELFISSLPQNLSFDLINKYVETFKDKTVLLNSKIDYLTERFPVYFIESSNHRLLDFVLTSIKYYKDRDYKYLQLIYPDTNGKFPNEKGYDYDQEIFGDFEIR
jgi:hypothetical protein